MRFTSESVARGHPDKICDQVADAILDAILEKDPVARVACEAVVKTGFVLLAGEITTTAFVDYPEVVRETLRRAGYGDPSWGFHSETCAILTALGTQSEDIALGVGARDGGEPGAGDQGTMFGYACRETPELMPAPIQFAHALTRGLARLRESGELPYLGPDGKSQVTVGYDGGHPRRLETVVVSTQHREEVPVATIEADLREHLFPIALPAALLDPETRVLVNPTGRFVIGGPQGDAGLTGRKCLVDTYGGMARHGGGALSGKDPSKVDRSAAYMARAIARNVVAAGLAGRCEVQLSYAIGIAEPVAVEVNLFETGEVSPEKLVRAIRATFPLTPRGIDEALQLRRPIYSDTATFGHFGRVDLSLPWETLDRTGELRKALG